MALLDAPILPPYLETATPGPVVGVGVPAPRIEVGVTPRRIPLMRPEMVEQMVDPGEHWPGWYWEAKDALGKPARGWTKRTAETLDAEMLRAHVAVKFHNLDTRHFKAHEGVGPPAIVMHCPRSWYWFNSFQLTAEWLAGLRPLGTTCPIEQLPGYRPPQPRPPSLYRRGNR